MPYHITAEDMLEYLSGSPAKKYEITRYGRPLGSDINIYLCVRISIDPIVIIFVEVEWRRYESTTSEREV